MTSISPNFPSLHSSCWLLDGTRGESDDIKPSAETLVSLSEPENHKWKLIYIFETLFTYLKASGNH